MVTNEKLYYNFCDTCPPYLKATMKTVEKQITFWSHDSTELNQRTKRYNNLQKQLIDLSISQINLWKFWYLLVSEFQMWTFAAYHCSSSVFFGPVLLGHHFQLELCSGFCNYFEICCVSLTVKKKSANNNRIIHS